MINDATFSVDENSANGSAVGGVPVTDPDAGDSHVYSIPVGNTGGAFAIDNAGNITVANSAALNFETTPVFTLTVQVRDQGGTGIIDTATITVNLNDINDAPVINDATFSVDENSANGSAVGGVPVTDPDAGDSHVYSIPVGNTGGAFAIDNAGNITVANSAALNFETTPVFTLTVQVRDQGGTGIIDTATITVNLNDINDAPVINDATFSVDENSANGSAVGGVPVTDPDAGDSHVYSIPVGNTGGAFAIDNAGNITVANSAALNFETTPVFTLTVQVRDQGGTGIIDTATITVNLNDINDAPVINDATFSVDENSANGSAVGGVPVTDPDAGDSHVYSIPVGNTGGAFAIDNAGNITVANSAALNFETTPVFTLTVQVRDQGGTGIIDTATITVNLNDINDAPVINDATFSVDENSANGSAVGGVPVTDPDAGDSHVYSIPVGNTGGAFAIDNAGNITVANSAALNFETTPVFTLTVQVRDQGGTGIIDTATITVNLNDINDAPVLTNNTGVAVLEGSSGNILNAAMLATTDADNTAGQLVYTLSGVPANGTLYLSGVALGTSDSFTQEDIDSGRITYDHDGSETVVDSFAFSVDDGVGAASNASFAITVTSVNDVPKISLINTTTTITEDVDTSSAIKVADIVITDDAMGINSLSLSGADAAMFEIVGGNALYLRAGVLLDAIGNPNLDVTVAVDDTAVVGAPDDAAFQTISVSAAVAVTPPPTTTVIDDPTDSGDTVEPEPDTAAETTEPIAEPEAEPVESVPEAVAPPVEVVDDQAPVSQTPSFVAARTPFLIKAAGQFTRVLATDPTVKAILQRQFNKSSVLREAAPADKGLQQADHRADLHNRMAARAYLNMVNSLDEVKKEMAGEIAFNKTVLGSAIAVSTGLSVGYVIWLIRGGMLLSSLLSSIPAWQILDPLPVLAGRRGEDEIDDDESLASIIDRKPQKKTAKKKPVGASLDTKESVDPGAA